MLIYCVLSRSLPPPKGNVLLTVTSPWNSAGEHILLYVGRGQKLQWRCWCSATHCQRIMKGYHFLVSLGVCILQKHHSFSVVFPKQQHQCQREGQVENCTDNQWLQPSQLLPPSAAGAAIALRQDNPPFQHCATGSHRWWWSHPSMGPPQLQPQPQSLPHGRRLRTNAANVTA
jgi:hypothetical protein